MTPAAALAGLRAAGVRVALRPDGAVRLAAPPPLVDGARAHRAGIVFRDDAVQYLTSKCWTHR